MKKFMYYKIDDDFDKRYNGSCRGNPSMISVNGSKDGLVLKAHGRARSALNLLNLNQSTGKFDRFKLSGPNTNSSTKFASGTQPQSNNSLTAKGNMMAMREGLPHKRAFSLMKNQPKYDDDQIKEGGQTETNSNKELVL